MNPHPDHRPDLHTHEPPPPALPDELEALLTNGLLDVPTDFTQRVMKQVTRVAPAPRLRTAWQAWQAPLQRLALLAGSLWGAVQLVGFIFGIWAATSAV